MLFTWFKNRNMKSGSHKEEPEDKKKYVFFSDPDVIAKRAETSAITTQISLDLEAQRQTIKNQLANSRVSAPDIKSLENLLSYHPVQPYPFTFISAVKQKLGDCITSAKIYNPSSQAKNNLTSSVLKTNSTQNFYPIVPKMDYIKPLKVPDLKISPKTLDFSSIDNSVSKELPSTKSETTAKEFALDRSDRSLRTGEKVQRKLDFFFPDGSIINCENIEPLKAPNVSIASNLCKKKEHVRDSSREKENKSKRMKKDDTLCAKRDEPVQEHTKRSRSPKHVSRKDASNTGNVRLPKNDKLFYATTSNDFLSMKLKDKNVIISTTKKDNEKRQRFFNAQSVELRDNPIGRISSNESLSDKITLRDNISVLCKNIETKSKDTCHMKQRSEIEDSKSDSNTSDHIFDLDNRQLKEDKSNSTYKEQIKRVYDKSKMSNNKIEGKQHSANSGPSKDIGSMSEINSSKNRAYHVNSTQVSKSKDLETATEIKQNINFARSIKISEKYAEHSERQLTSTSTKKDEESYSRSIVSKETTTNDDSNNVDVSILPEVLFDVRRISFRDGYFQQEFQDLATPETVNFVRSKRRRNLIPSSDSEVDASCPKYKPTINSEKEQEEGQLMHPKALHKQFRAELQLYDTFNESLRQVIDVEKCLYNTKCKQEQKNSQKVMEKDEELERTAEDGYDNNTEKALDSIDCMKKNVTELSRPSDESQFNKKYYVLTNQTNVDESAGINYENIAVVKVAEVQTQTVNDIATQTNISTDKPNAEDKILEIDEKMYEQSSSVENYISQQFLSSIEQFENLDQIDDISVPSRIKTMSEISLHETTSSIKTETGTEISISTRDVTFSINQYMDSEIEQLIRDENLRCNKMKELLKFQEKTLNDKTKKLAQLEEQKRVLRDTGQDSRSLKKKQRALLLKLQQEQELLTQIKRLHQHASQERMNILQKQKDMFNPEMTTRNILTKLKRSADSSSPRRLSGPMKGYDIRSNSSKSSVIESDKSQHDGSHIESCLQRSEGDSIKLDLVKSDDLIKCDELREKDPIASPKRSDISKHELRSRKYEEKMPRADILQWKQNQRDMESKWIQGHPMKMKRLLENQESSIGVSQSSKLELINTSVPDHAKSESDTLVEELSKKSRTSQDLSVQTATIAKEKELTSNTVTVNNGSIEEEIKTITQDTVSKTSQISEDILQTNTSKSFKKIEKSITSDRDISKKSQYSEESNANSKHKNLKYQKVKSSSNTLTENIPSKSSSHLSEEVIKHQDKRTKLEHELLNNNKDSILSELDFNESQKSLVKHSKLVKDKNLKSSETSNDYESKENVSSQVSNRKLADDENSSRNERSNTQNISTSRISTFAISHRSSKESEKNLSKSIVVRSQDRHLEQILNARETAVVSRKNCLKNLMAWHARLKVEENRVTRMEQTAYKLVATYSNILNQLDTTISSDTSDVEGRIGVLAKKLEERRIEIARLKREAKKQTKKQLRALEANLLNQIKKYDMTIHEMRKKLETKKTIKETDKLAIEPKSLADFKVPEIPLKRIQDIYKSSDLLRSRSESDLLVTRNQQKNLSKIISITYDDKLEKDSCKKSKYMDTKSTNISELKDNHIVPDEFTSSEAYNKIRPATSVLSTANDAHLEKYLTLSKKTHNEESEIKQNSTSGNVEENVETNLSTVRSESEVRTLSDARFVDHSTINTESRTNKGSTTDVDRSRPKTNLAIRAENREIENVYYIKAVPIRSDYSTESAACTVADSDILTYSRKLDYLQLNNKNLSEDISLIENDIKAFSEMISRLNNESNEKSKVENDERNTSQDISEIISKSVFSDKISNNISNEEKHISSDEINTKLRLTNNEKSKSLDDLSHDKYKSDEIINSETSIISEEVHLSDLAREIDYEAKSKEIMNQIEKSIISEHVKTSGSRSILENEDKELNDLVSELEVKSISEIFSKMSESRKNLDRAANIIDDSEKRISEQKDLNEKKLEKDFVKNRAEKAERLLKFSEHFHSPIISGHRLKENCETQNTVSNKILLHVAKSKDLESDNIPEVLKAEIGTDTRILKSLDEDVETSLVRHSKHSHPASNVNQDQSHTTIDTENISQDRSNWTTSDSFQVPQDEISTGEQDDNSRSREDHTDVSNNFSKKNVSHCVDDASNLEAKINSTNDINVSTCVPKGESTKVEVHDITFNNVLTDSQVIKNNDELDDILDIIAREENISDKENEKLDNVISDSMAELLEKVKDIVENDQRSNEVDNRYEGILDDINISVNDETDEAVLDLSSLNDKAQGKINEENISETNTDYPNTHNDNKPDNEKIDISLQTVDETEEKAKVNLQVEMDNEESPRKAIPEMQEIIITELDSDSVEDNVLSELEIDAKVELAEEEESAASYVNEDEEKKDIVEIKECLESIVEQDSSDGEQLDNLVEVAESGLDTVEKIIATCDFPESLVDEAVSEVEETEERTNDPAEKTIDKMAISDNAPIIENLNKTFDILKDPEYEDISEESLEVSEILDKNDLPKTKKSSNLPDKYQATQRSEEVLRILDEISQRSSSDSTSNSQRNEEKNVAQSETQEEISELLDAEVSAEDDNSSPEMMNKMMTGHEDIEEKSYQVDDESEKDRFLERRVELPDEATGDADLVEEKDDDEENKSARIIYELQERVSRLQEQDGSSGESSEAGDTPRGVSDIEMDSPRDFNDSRLDIDILDDDLLSGTKAMTNQNVDVKTNFHPASIVATSENDITAMIDKLKDK
ncbi:protein PFC0760c-like isoform X2 [Nylanderia fulva]|uniref:protein PFC0760c-like isoform X2 n=1 Tax=Nylanderia fulva TaxID=613905 RepID=UPI0010FB6986|nr:protein PFC0760c-like isoform X2 [Nylanderia fulva]